MKHREFLKTAQQQLKQMTEPLISHQDHLKCLQIIKIPVAQWSKFKSSNDYSTYIHDHFTKTEVALSNMLKWHIMYNTESNTPIVEGLSERIKFPSELHEEAIKIKDPEELVEFTMNNLSPIGPLQILPTRHDFREWFLQQRNWPNNISFQPFNKGHSKVDVVDFKSSIEKKPKRKTFRLGKTD